MSTYRIKKIENFYQLGAIMSHEKNNQEYNAPPPSPTIERDIIDLGGDNPSPIVSIVDNELAQAVWEQPSPRSWTERIAEERSSAQSPLPPR